MRLPSLPEHLRYLEPFRKKFVSRRPEELNEDSGSAALMPLLSKRVHGLSLLDAERVLSDDFSAVQQWLVDPAHQNDPLQFLLGFSLIASPEGLAKHIKEMAEKPPEPLLCLHMELPPGATLRRVPDAQESGKLVKLRGLWLAIEALPAQTVRKLYDATLRNAQPANRSQYTVAFGQITGRKFITRLEAWNGECKQVGYSLAVPGGDVWGTISAIGKKLDSLNWDESPFEQCFHTLRIESKPPLSTHRT